MGTLRSGPSRSRQTLIRRYLSWNLHFEGEFTASIRRLAQLQDQRGGLKGKSRAISAVLAGAGADIIGVGDAAASLVGPRIYKEFVWPWEKKLVDAIHANGGKVRLHICGNTRRILSSMAELGCDIVDIDFLVPLEEARAQMGPL